MAIFAHCVAADENASRVKATVDGARHMGVFSGRQIFTGAFNVIAHAAEGFDVRNGIVSAAFAEVDKARASPPTTIIILNMLVSRLTLCHRQFCPNATMRTAQSTLFLWKHVRVLRLLS